MPLDDLDDYVEQLYLEDTLRQQEQRQQATWNAALRRGQTWSDRAVTRELERQGAIQPVPLVQDEQAPIPDDFWQYYRNELRKRAAPTYEDTTDEE